MQKNSRIEITKNVSVAIQYDLSESSFDLLTILTVILFWSSIFPFERSMSKSLCTRHTNKKEESKCGKKLWSWGSSCKVILDYYFDIPWYILIHFYVIVFTWIKSRKLGGYEREVMLYFIHLVRMHRKRGKVKEDRLDISSIALNWLKRWKYLFF